MERPTAYDINEHQEYLDEVVREMTSLKDSVEAHGNFEVTTNLSQFNKWIGCISDTIKLFDAWLKER